MLETGDATSRQGVLGAAAGCRRDRHDALGHGGTLLQSTPDAPPPAPGNGVRVGYCRGISALPQRRRTLLVFGLVWGALVLWWSTIPASNSRDWQPDVAVLPSATLDGDRVTLHNIRNFEYRTETDFTPRYYDKTFDLQQLQSVDLISVYWGGGSHCPSDGQLWLRRARTMSPSPLRPAKSAPRTTRPSRDFSSSMS